MSIEEQLKQHILSRYKSIREFTMAIDIPYTTLDSVFRRGISNAGVSTIIRIFQALDLDVESIPNGTLRMSNDTKKEPTTPEGDRLKDEEREIIQLYRSVDPATRAAMLQLLRAAEAGRLTQDAGEAK